MSQQGKASGARMTKLMNIKRWLTISEAARYLSIVLGDEASEADVLQLGLEGTLNLSLELINGAMARRGTLVDSSFEVSADDLKCEDFIRIDAGRTIRLEQEVIPILGTFQVPLWGGHVFLKKKHQQLLGGPEVELIAMRGIIVKRGEEYYQLHSYFDSIETCVGSLAYESALRNGRLRDTQELRDIGLSHFKDDRDSILLAMKNNPRNGYIPSHTMPSDIVLLVETSDLVSMLQSFATDSPPTGDKPLASKERKSLLIVIAALCDYSNIDHQQRGVAQQIMNMTDEIGSHLDDGTILKILKQVRDALGQ